MNITVAAVFLTYFLIYVPRVFVARAQSALPEGLDNAEPRAQQARLTGRAARALAAHNNAFEDFAPFAAAALFCRYSPGYANGKDIVDGLAVAHLLLRAVYLGLYIGGVPTARTLVWVLCQLTTAGLFFSAFTWG